MAPATTTFVGIGYVLLFLSVVGVPIVTGIVVRQWRLYRPDYLSLAAASIAAAGVIALAAPSNAIFRSDVGIALAVVLLGYTIELSKRLRDKNDLRSATLTDIVAIVTLLDVIREFEFDWLLAERVIEIVRRAREIDDMSPAGNTRQNALANDLLAAPPLVDGSRPATRHILEQLTAFTSQEDYFVFIDSLGPRISDLPKPDPVREFYTLLRGSRDLMRRKQLWRLRVLDLDLEDLRKEVNNSARWAVHIMKMVVDACIEAIRQNSVGEEQRRRLGALKDLRPAMDQAVRIFELEKGDG